MEMRVKIYLLKDLKQCNLQNLYVAGLRADNWLGKKTVKRWGSD